MVVVTDHDSKVLARRTFRCKAWDLGAALDWAADRAAQAGFAGVTVACEPTGHRWRVLGQLAAERGHVVRVRAAGAVVVGAQDRGPDQGQDRRQGRGADRPADRAAALLPARTGRRDLGSAAAPRHPPRAAARASTCACVQQIRDLLECVWPAALEAAKHPFRSTTWVAAMSVVMDRDGGDLARTRRLGRPGSSTRCAAEVTRRGKVRPCLRIVRTPVRRADRHRRGAGAPARRVRADRVDLTGLGRRPGQARRRPRPGWSPSWTSWG